MKTNRAPFRPLDADTLDQQVEIVAREKGVGALVKPAQQPEQATRTAAASRPKAEADPEAATPRTPMKTLNVELPDYLWTALKIRAAEKQTTVRHLIMTALRRDEFSIQESDMIDANLRTRGQARGPA